MKQSDLYLFHGDDTYSLLQRIRLWQDEFSKKYGDTNLETLNGNEIDANYLQQAIKTMPFLGEKRLIIVKNFLAEGNNDEQKKILAHLEDIPETCVLVFAENGSPDKRTALFKKLKKEGHLVEFPILEGYELTQWIKKEVQKQNGAINDDAASYLGSIIGGNLWTLSNEIKKLCAYCEKRPMTLMEVELLVNANLHHTIFQFTDAIGQKNAKVSLNLLHNLMENGEDLIRIFSMIIRQFRLIIQIKDMKDRGIRENEIISKLKLHPFVVRKTLQQCANFDISRLKEIYAKLLKIDTGIKTGKLKELTTDHRDLTLELDKFITEICNITAGQSK